MNVLFIFRAPEFSPNMEDKDATILKAVADRVKDMGHTVRFMKETELTQPQTDVQTVFSMGRRESTVRILGEMQRTGIKVSNSPASIVLSSDRADQTRRLMGCGIPVPPTTVTELDSDVSYPGFPLWIKRGDGFSQNPRDVAYVATLEEAEDHLCWMRRQGYRTAVCSRHLDGDLLKFYGVAGGAQPFFYWYYAADGHSKFGLERRNGTAQVYGFDQDCLRTVCESAARVAGLTVYGGDCIVDRDGGVFLIDLNDWPSFSRCRQEAAGAIGALVDVHE